MLEHKKKLGLAALSLTAAATVLGAGVARAAEGDEVTVPDSECASAKCIVIGPGPGDGPFHKFEAPFHKIDAMSKVMLKIGESSPAFHKINSIFLKFNEQVNGGL